MEEEEEDEEDSIDNYFLSIKLITPLPFPSLFKLIYPYTVG